MDSGSLTGMTLSTPSLLKTLKTLKIPEGLRVLSVLRTSQGGRTVAGRRRGRSSAFRPELGEALIALIRDDVSIKHAAKRIGLGVRTVYDWLAKGHAEGADSEFARWADCFAKTLEARRSDWRAERYARESEEAKQRWRGPSPREERTRSPILTGGGRLRRS
jgi:Helix-turn-helix domain